jgi:hypothetical protein
MLFALGTQFLSIPKNTAELIIGYNPAIVMTSARPMISATYGNWLADMKVSSLQYDRSLFDGWFGLDFRYISLNDLELRSERPTDEPLSMYSTTAFALESEYAHQFKFGVMSTTIRYISLQLFDEETQGIAVDLGLSKQINERFDIGLAVLNIGNMSELHREKPQLPVRTILGATYGLNLYNVLNSLSAAVEKSSLVDGMIFRMSDVVHLGKVQVLIGSQIAENATSLSCGINLKLGSYQFGYGIQIGTQGLGSPQMFSMSVILP